MATGDMPEARRSSPADLGLLMLRLGVGATMIQAGLIKAFDFGTATAFMESAGWRAPTFAAGLLTTAETAGGIGLLLGLLTPIAACAVMAAMIDPGPPRCRRRPSGPSRSTCRSCPRSGHLPCSLPVQVPIRSMLDSLADRGGPDSSPSRCSSWQLPPPLPRGSC